MNVDYLSDNRIDNNNIIDPEVFENPDNLPKIGENLNNKPLPEYVNRAIESVDLANKLNSTLKELDGYLNELKNNPSTKPEEIACLEDCINRKFKKIDVNDILDVRSREMESVVVRKMGIADFAKKYGLFVEEEKTPSSDGQNKLKWKSEMSDRTKLFLVTKYNEIFRLLWIDKVSDSELTFGKKDIVDDQFIDIKNSDSFELSENFENPNSEWKEFWQWILDKISLAEWRRELWWDEDKINNITIQCIKDEIDEIIDKDEKKIVDELWNSINTKLEWENDLRVSMEDRAYLFAQNMIFMWEYRTAYPSISPSDLYKLLNSNQNKLLHQHLWDVNTITSSDHWIKHVLRWDLTMAEVVFSKITPEQREQLFIKNNWWKNPTELELLQFQSQIRVLTMQATMDHDFGYTNIINRKFDEMWYEKWYYMQSDHPLWSTFYIQSNEERYKQYFGEEWYNTLIDIVPWHWNAKTESINKISKWTATSSEIVSWILSTVDCAWSPWDYKIAHMFAQKEIIWSLFNAYSLLEANNLEWAKTWFRNLRETIQQMSEWSIRDSRLNWVEAFLKTWNFENMDEKQLNNIFGFYFKKFIWAYWIKTSIDDKTWNPECWINNDWGFEISFELAWKSFEYVYNSFWADIALKSFTSVCGDYWISKEWQAIKSLEKVIKDASEKRKNDDKKSGFFNGYINSAFDEYIKSFIGEVNLDDWTSIKKIDNRIIFKGPNDNWISLEKIDDGIIIRWPNSVSITLKFDWKSYEWFDDSIEKINQINNKIDELVVLLETPENLNQIDTFVTNLQLRLADLGSFFGNNDFVWHEDLLGEISRSIVNLSDNTNIDDIKNQVEQIRTAYRFQIKDVSSSNPNINGNINN